MPEHILAALLGALISAARYTKHSLLKTVRVALVGFCVAFFLTDDAIRLAQFFMGISLSKSGAWFLLAYVGADLLEKGAYIIQSHRAAASWK